MTKKRSKNRKEVDKRLIAAGAGVFILIFLFVVITGIPGVTDRNIVGFAGEQRFECTAQPSGLVHWWTEATIDGVFEDVIGDADGQPVGNVADDLSPAGKVGNAFKFDGNGDYIDVGLEDFAPIGGTVAFWAKSDINLADSFFSKYLIGRDSNGPGDGDFSVYYDSFTDQIKFFLQTEVPGESIELGTGFDPAPDEWNFYAFTWDPNDFNVYINKNVHRTAEAVDFLESTTSLVIGLQRVNGLVHQSWEGLIDEVMIFDRALGRTELNSIIDAGERGVCREGCNPETAGSIFGNQYCDGRQLIECNIDTVGQTQGDYVCEANAAGDFSWELACNANTKYKQRLNERGRPVICDGLEFLTCPQIQAQPIFEADVLVGCLGRGDDDGDGVDDFDDNCFMIPNGDQADSNRDGVGDICELPGRPDDYDGDGHDDLVDNCPQLPNEAEEDLDGDGDIDEDDQEDTDGDGIGDACDATRRGRAFDFRDIVFAFERNCNDGLDNDNDGLTDLEELECSDRILDYHLGTHPTLSSFELALRTDDGLTTGVYGGDLLAGPKLVYFRLNICDPGIPSRDEVTYCYADFIDGFEEQTIQSMETHAETNQHTPFIVEDRGVSVIYQESNPPKTVDFLHTVTLTDVAPEDDVDGDGNPDGIDGSIHFNKHRFKANMAAGQRVMINFSNKYFILSHPKGNVFNTEDLILTRFPTGEPHGAVRDEGTTMFRFADIEGSDIVVQVVGNDFVISSVVAGERAEAFIGELDVKELFETTFTRETPLRLLYDGEDRGLFTICNRDRNAHVTQVLMCHDAGAEEVALSRDELVEVPAFPGLAFMYEKTGAEKQISVFRVEPLNDIITPLLYTEFIDAMVEERRIAFKFLDSLYLAEHEASIPGEIHLPDINIVKYSLDVDRNQVVTTAEAEGGEHTVDFMVEGGRITIELPPGLEVPFEASALTSGQIAEESVDLKETFFQSMSNQVPTRITGPQDIGLLSVATGAGPGERDTEGFANEFLVNAQNPLGGALAAGRPVILELGTPLQLHDNILAYYHTARPDPIENSYLKLASLHLYYDLDAGAPKAAELPAFDDEFIDVITQGGDNQIALKFNGNYYTLGHQGSPLEVRFFRLEDLQLHNLSDQAQTYTREVDGNTAQFIVPGGKIIFTLDVPNNVFTITTDTEELNEGDFEPYQMQLTTRGKMKFGDSFLFMCEQDEYRFLEEADLCLDETIRGIDLPLEHIVINSTLIQNISYDKAGAPVTENYWLELNGETADAKEVMVRQILDVNDIDDWTDWTEFSNKIIGENIPFVAMPIPSEVDLIGRLYTPETETNIIRDFAFVSHPDNVRYPIRNLEMESPVHGNGTFVLHDTILNVYQRRVRINDRDRRTEVVFRKSPYLFVPENFEPIVWNMTNDANFDQVTFITGLGGTKYTLILDQPGEELVKLVLEDEDSNVFFNRFFGIGDSREIVLGVDRIQITVHSIADDVNPGVQFTPTVSIGRVQ